MNTLKEITKGELTKIMARGKSKALLILMSLFTLGSCVVYFILQSHLNLTLIEGQLFPIWVLNRLMSFILPLLVFLLIGDTFSGEFQDGTIKNAFALPASRNTLYVAKLLAVALYILMMLGGIALISFIGAVIVTGFSAIAGIGYLLIAYLGAFIVLGLIELMASFVALFINSSSFSLVINILIWLSMGTIGAFVAGLSPYLPTSFTHWYEPLIKGGNPKLVIPILLYMISYYIILTIFGMMKFQKREG